MDGVRGETALDALSQQTLRPLQDSADWGMADGV